MNKFRLNAKCVNELLQNKNKTLFSKALKSSMLQSRSTLSK